LSFLEQTQSLGVNSGLYRHCDEKASSKVAVKVNTFFWE